MSEFETLARTLDSMVIRYDDGGITYANEAAVERTGFERAELLGTEPAALFPERPWAELEAGGADGVGKKSRVGDEGEVGQRSRVGDESEVGERSGAREHGGMAPGTARRYETRAQYADGSEHPVEVCVTGLEGDETVLLVTDLTDRRRRERYLQFIRDVNELVIRADDEPTLLSDIIDIVADRPVYGCTSIATLDARGVVDHIYGRMESWCEMDWDAVYSPEYVERVLEAGVVVFEDVTQGTHRQHVKERGDHGAIAIALRHRGRQYGILTMHLPGKGSLTTDEERTLLRELGANVATGIYNLRTEAELRDSRKQLAVLDRVLRHNLHNAMTVIAGHAESLADVVPDDRRHHAETITETGRRLLEMTDKEREIVDLLMEPSRPTEIDLVAIVEATLASLRDRHPAVEATASLPDGAVVETIPEIDRAVEELLENAVVHNDRDRPRVEIDLTQADDRTELTVVDDGPGIPAAEFDVLSAERSIDSLEHGSGLGLWLVNWIVKRSDGEIEVEERDPRGSVVTLRLPSVPG